MAYARSFALLGLHFRGWIYTWAEMRHSIMSNNTTDVTGHHCECAVW